ncbi:hypothetical protein JCM15765_08430 [Paradesulfitobacterium aromaticivorans]
MRIVIRLYGPLAKYGQQADLHELNISANLSLNGLIEFLNIPSSAIAFMVVNGVKTNINYLLQENDTVKVFPWVAGG